MSREKKTIPPSRAQSPSTNGPLDSPSPERVAWPMFLSSATDDQIAERFKREVSELCARHSEIIENYCLVSILSPQQSIGTYTADRIFQALSSRNANKEKDVLLVLLSPGGSIEPAYQISKLCKGHSKSSFVVVVPRQAKSAATLIALGADEIHMGSLGQLGPIDPQLGGLPALGVVQALQRIAAVSESHPGSSEMFARYLRMALTVEQIGFCERISQSAAQYAQRLLGNKGGLARDAGEIAQRLVYEYKDHGFVIDYEEAASLLGTAWIKNDSNLVSFAESVYGLFEMVDVLLRVFLDKKISLVGSLLDLPKIMSSKID